MKTARKVSLPNIKEALEESERNGTMKAESEKMEAIAKEPLRLIRWADDGYPPIDLTKELSGILDLIREVKRLRKETKEDDNQSVESFRNFIRTHHLSDKWEQWSQNQSEHQEPHWI